MMFSTGNCRSFLKLGLLLCYARMLTAMQVLEHERSAPVRTSAISYLLSRHHGIRLQVVRDVLLRVLGLALD